MAVSSALYRFKKASLQGGNAARLLFRMDILGRFQTACVNRAWHADNQYDEATVPEFISLRNEIRPSEKYLY
jgi:hypothetical protein